MNTLFHTWTTIRPCLASALLSYGTLSQSPASFCLTRFETVFNQLTYLIGGDSGRFFSSGWDFDIYQGLRPEWIMNNSRPTIPVAVRFSATLHILHFVDFFIQPRLHC